MSKKTAFALLCLLLTSCSIVNNISNKLYNTLGRMSNKYHDYEWCGMEFYHKYHPTFPSKTCTVVAHRKCVQQNYCKGDKQCELEVAKYSAYQPYLTRNDEEYCLCTVNAEKTDKNYARCSEI